MKIAYCTDLHGWPSLYYQLVGFCRSERPDVLLLGGDLLPDGRPPSALQTQTTFIAEVLRPWREQLRVELPTLRVLTVLGNHDWLAAAETIAQPSPRQVPAVSGAGHAHNGHAHNGHAHNGHAHNGHAHNGRAHNGHAHNGHAHNGHAHNGHAQNGHAQVGSHNGSPRLSVKLEVGGAVALAEPPSQPPLPRPSADDALLEWLSPNEPIAVSVGDAAPVEVYGCSYVPATPFWVKDFERRDRPSDALHNCGRRAMISRAGELHSVEPAEYLASLPSIAEELSAVPATGMDRAIWVSHAPPADTDADLMYGGAHVGSRAVREFLEARQPRVSLHGHIHEAPALSGSFASWLGPTLVINPGRSTSHLDAVVFDWADPAATLRHSRLGRWRA